MTIEEKLKSLILTKYKSIREFVQYADMPYSSVDSMFRRGIHNSSVSNVIKLCKALNISADELANGRIVPKKETVIHRVFLSEIPEMVSLLRRNPDDFSDMTIDGKKLSPEERESLLDGLDMSVGIIRRKRERVK